MLPMSHAATSIVAQPGEIGTSGAIPPGHVTNLMLPSHLSNQPIPVHAVTLMPMTSGQPQVLYSMSSQSSVPPGLMSGTVTASTSLPASSHLADQVIAGQMASPSVGSSGDIATQRQSSLPQITTVQGALQTGNINTSLSNQIMRQVISPVSVHSQISAPSNIRTIQDHLPTRVQSASPVYTGIPSLRSDNVIDTKRLEVSDGVLNSTSVLKPEDSLNTGDTLVVEMKPVGMNEGKAVQSPDITQNDHNDPSMPIGFVTDGADVAQEIVSENEFKEPTLTLSEEGVVNKSIDNASNSALQAGVELHTVVESRE
jgi:hypothetical protein